MSIIIAKLLQKAVESEILFKSKKKKEITLTFQASSPTIFYKELVKLFLLMEEIDPYLKSFYNVSSFPRGFLFYYFK